YPPFPYTTLFRSAGFVPPQIGMADDKSDFRPGVRHASGFILVIEFRGSFGNRHSAELVHDLLWELRDVKCLLLVAAQAGVVVGCDQNDVVAPVVRDDDGLPMRERA